MDGKKITFKGNLSSPWVNGDANGVIYYGSDLSARRSSTAPARPWQQRRVTSAST